MTPQLELLIQQAIQLDREERLELITHLADSLHSGESHNSELELTDLQNVQLKQLQAEIEVGLDDQEGRVFDGETVFATLQQRIDRHREKK